MKTAETTQPRNSDYMKLIERLCDDKCQLSMSERRLCAKLLLQGGPVLLLGLQIARTAVDKRTGTRVALLAVIHYLRTCGVSPKLWDPLHALWCALADVDRGISNKLVDRMEPHARSEAARVHQAARRRSSRVAAGGRRAAARQG